MRMQIRKIFCSWEDVDLLIHAKNMKGTFVLVQNQTKIHIIQK